jgi:hypothetical protein
MSHSLLAPSGASKWMACPGSIRMEQGLPDTAGFDAAEGTAAHELAAMCLTNGIAAKDLVGTEIKVRSRVFVVDQDMARHVQTYVDTVITMVGGAPQSVERRVDFSDFLGVRGSTGTADAIGFLHGAREIQVHDLKFGRGVKVYAENNKQLMLYALGALAGCGFDPDNPTQFRLVIHQPRLDHVSEWVISVEDLLAFGREAKRAAQRVIYCLEEDFDPATDLLAGEEQCRWCKAKATCPALREHVLSAVSDDFVDLTKPIKPQLASAVERLESSDGTHIANCLGAVDLIEGWCKSVRAKAESDLLEGRDVPGFKLVEGKRGHRKWAEPKQVEALLKSMRLKHQQIYDYSLISPTQAERLAKADAIGERQWAKLQQQITQATGGPSVVPVADKRPAIGPIATMDDFNVLTDLEQV